MKRICVLGAGIMGSGIFQVAASAGLEVRMRDVEESILKRGFESIEMSLERFLKKGKLSKKEVSEILSRIKGFESLEKASKNADFVIEAVPENIKLKLKVFSQLDKICPKHVIFATNTSGLSITEIASATKRPERVIGMHFFNPAPIMRLVEIVRGFKTSDETFEVTQELSKKFGKETVCVREFPGFVTTRMLAVICNEAAFMLQEGLASKKDIDKAINLGLNHPMGPLELSDFVGLDVLLEVLENLYREFGDSKYRACYLIKKLVRAKRLGVKTGRGFYEY
ncbi:MAG: 3-hydroxyacyl-CoA dehydrogenase family protein [Candidatus Methanofastidiosia archaeon]